MDYANFPGSNLKLAEHQAGDKEGQLVQLLGGWKVESIKIDADGVGSGCSNFVEKASPADADTPLNPRDDSIALAFGPDVDGTQLCKTTDDYDKNLNAGWNRGWVVAPECDRTTDENVCAFWCQFSTRMVWLPDFWHACYSGDSLRCTYMC